MINLHDAHSSSDPIPKLATVPNKYPLVATHIHLTYPFAQLCPMSGEPQPGSTITISYEADKVLLEIKALRQYLASYMGENPHNVRDLEEAAQVIAQHCADVLQKPVQVIAHYHLKIGEMEVKVCAEPHT